jgi:L-2-hydroxyglutarate oxidase LhgO
MYKDYKETDFLIIGAGIIGLSLAINLKKAFPNKTISIIEKEDDIGKHSSGRNSGVLHAGFYYHPDSLKAKFTKIGNKQLTNYCEEKKLRINKCGKVVVTKTEEEIDTLLELKKRAETNQIEVYLVDEKELREIEPNAKTFKYALWSPKTSVIDPLEVIRSIKKDLEDQEVSFYFLNPYQQKINDNTIKTKNYIFEYGKLFNCAGLYADKIAKEFGLSQNYLLVPFKGIYLETDDQVDFLKRNIYPVPNLRTPFLGVHFTLKPDNKLKIGPTAIPSLWRENYKNLDNFKFKEFIEVLKMYTLMFLKNELFRNTAIEEVKKYSKKYMLQEASKLVNKLNNRSKYYWGKSGIRAQLINIKTLDFVNDFVIEVSKNSIHILNSVSPAFTASFPFTSYIIENYLRIKNNFDKQ